MMKVLENSGKFIFLIALLTLSTAQAEASGAKCEAAFGLNGAYLDRVNERLTHELKDPHGVVRKLEIKSDAIEIVKYLGMGYSGIVYQVRYQGKDLALKLFRRERVDNQVYSGIVMQKHLAELGMAPSVDGVLRSEEVAAVVSRHRSFFENNGRVREGEVELGLLMELVSEKNFKSHFFPASQRIHVNQFTKDRVLNQAVKYLSILQYLGIRPQDPDGALTPRGDLILIDTAFYTKESFVDGPEINFLLSITDSALTTEPTPQAKTDKAKSWWRRLLRRDQGIPREN